MNIREIMAKAIPAVEFMYDRVAEIQRYVDYDKPNGAKGKRWETVHPEVPCRLSSAQLDNTTQGAANVVDYVTKMFLSSNYKVLAGDKIYVSDPDDTNRVQYKSAKEPFVYVSHQEVLLNREGYA